MPKIFSSITTESSLFEGRPALKTLVLYSAGIFSGCYLSVFPATAIFITIIFLIGAGVFHLRKSGRITAILIYISLFLCGIAQYKLATSSFSPTHISRIASKASAVTIKGNIVEEPDIRTDRTYLVVEVDSITWRKRDVESSGNILVKIKKQSTYFSFKDRIKFTGYLFTPGSQRNPGGFDFARYLNYREIFGMVVLKDENVIEVTEQPSRAWWNLFNIWSLDYFFINKMVAPFRSVLLDGYKKYLPADHASLLAGFILGEKRNIPENVARLFRDTGTFHLMAVSGSNVAVIIMFCLIIFYPLRRRLKLVLILCAVVFFCFLTRNEPSVVRASVMASVGLIGFYRQKDADTIGLLGFAGLLVLIVKPLWLFNAGFQLSVAACAGILYFLPKFNYNFRLKNKYLTKAISWLFITIITTVSAQIAVMPLIAQYFNRLPLIGILANIPMILIAGFLTISGLFFLPFMLLGDTAATLYAIPIDYLISTIVPLLDFFAEMPMAVKNVGAPGMLIILLFYCTLYIISELVFVKRLSLNAVIISLIALTGIIWTSYLKGVEAESLTFIDCGPDRAILYSSGNETSYLWYNCHEDSICYQFESSLVPFIYKFENGSIDTIFTDKPELAERFRSEFEVGSVIITSDLIKSGKSLIPKRNSAYSVESILNKRVKLVWFKSDNNIESLEDGYFYELKTNGGICLLAGELSPRLAAGTIKSALLIELPWSVQPYGTVFEKLQEYRPAMLVFSPVKGRFSMIRNRQKLTYMNDIVMATSINGCFRIKMKDNGIIADYMVNN